MATLSTEAIDNLHQIVMELYSLAHTEIPITKVQLRQLLVLIDEELETAETSMVQALPVSDAKTWLVGHPAVGRFMIEQTVAKRRETL